MKKIVVLVSGTGTNLNALINAFKNDEIKNAKIECVISSNNHAKAVEIAKEAGLKTKIIDVKSFDDKAKFQEKLFLTLKELSPDLIVLAGFLQIIGKQIIDHFKNRIINIHPSLIPSFCGAGVYGLKVHEAALERGVKITGATVHFVNEIADDGPIILQKAVEIKQDDDAKTLQKRVMKEAEWQILKKAVNLICLDKIEIRNKKTYIKN